MVGAIEFLRKAKAICKADKDGTGTEIMFDIFHIIGDMEKSIDEADLVSKVMAYEIKEDGNA